MFIPISQLVFTGNEEKYVLDAVQSTWVSSLGKYIEQFEEKFAEYIGSRYAISTTNGTCALHLALKALDIGPGDEVIVPDFTFAATVNAVLHAGASPVLVDSMENHWNMDPVQFERAISERTKAVIPVHLYGHPCDMSSILEIARKSNIYVIEDAAEAHGAICMGKKVGSLGDIGCFSFYGNKVITSGEGGMCVTDDSILNDRLRKLRDHGMNKNKRYWHDEIGFNYRMTNLNAAVGLAQLEQIETFLEKRSNLAKLYETGLERIPGLRIYTESPFGKNINWIYCVFIEREFPLERDVLLTKLKEHNIDSRPTFYPVHMMPPYNDLIRSGDLVNSKRFGLSGINLPVYPSLSQKHVEFIISILKELSEKC
jgi:perosamine synthetase